MQTLIRNRDEISKLILVLLFGIACSAPVRAALSEVQTPEDKILAKGFAAYMDGADKQALSYFEEVIRINPKNGAAQKGLEKVKIRMRKAEDQEKAKARALAKAKYKEGREMMKTNDLVAAIDAFHAAVDATPDYAAPKKELENIRKRMTKVSAKKQLNLSSWAYARGVIAYLDRDWAKAYRIWSERSRIEPQNVAMANATARAENKFKRMMISEQEDFFRRGARAFYEQGLYKDSKSSWGRVLAMRPDDLEALEGQARAQEAILRAEGKGHSDQMNDILEQGFDYYAKQNWSKALGSFEQLVQLDPNHATAAEYIAKIKDRMATSSYSPTNIASDTLFRGDRPSNSGESVKVPDKLENFSASIAELKKQQNRDPSDINIQRKLRDAEKAQEEESEKIYREGLVAYSQGNRAMAIQLWKQVLVINPQHKKAGPALNKARAEEARNSEGVSEQ